eukprot:TRINITY_DN669_c1_g5_i1.p1 TRINITY_DN669_c1_g5~~TRINITY_DN669_c1_g5_i1.p1  ORF type:complete len:256 (+),score=100.33 TRINITY_DN669_c1_g5_i1:90-857(+)
MRHLIASESLKNSAEYPSAVGDSAMGAVTSLIATKAPGGDILRTSDIAIQHMLRPIGSSSQTGTRSALLLMRGLGFVASKKPVAVQMLQQSAALDHSLFELDANRRLPPAIDLDDPSLGLEEQDEKELQRQLDLIFQMGKDSQSSRRQQKFAGPLHEESGWCEGRAAEIANLVLAAIHKDDIKMKSKDFALAESDLLFCLSAFPLSVFALRELASLCLIARARAQGLKFIASALHLCPESPDLRLIFRDLLALPA